MKNLNSIMRENCEEFISLSLTTRNSKRPSRVLARNWTNLWLPLCLAKISKNNQNCGNGESNKVISKFVCISEASESTRLRNGRIFTESSWRYIAGKGDNSLQHYKLVHKFILMPQALKIPAAEAAVDKDWENWRNFRRGTWRKSEVRKRWSMKQGRRALQFILHH